MKIEINYGNGVSVIPLSAVSKLDRATKRDLRVLISLTAHNGYDFDEALAAKECGCTPSEFEASVSFWRGAGIVGPVQSDEAETTADNVDATVKKENKTVDVVTVRSEKTEIKDIKVKPEPSDELPQYTTAELTALLEKRRDAAALIDECQNIIGKLFNPQEINIVLGLLDYVGVDGEYILILTDHCSRIGKKSLHYLRKLAFSMLDEGINDASSLRERLRKIEAAATVDGEIRTIFGMKSRAMSTKEKKYVTTWTGDFGYGTDMIRKAYEMTVDTIHEPSMAYANAIMVRWHDDGLKTPEDVDKAQAVELPKVGSFDTNDFFEAALSRSIPKEKQK